MSRIAKSPFDGVTNISVLTFGSNGKGNVSAHWQFAGVRWHVWLKEDGKTLVDNVLYCNPTDPDLGRYDAGFFDTKKTRADAMAHRARVEAVVAYVIGNGLVETARKEQAKKEAHTERFGDLVIPLAHMNGTGGYLLTQSYKKAIEALVKTYDVVQQETCPNMRDYYPLSGGGEAQFQKAIDQHKARLMRIYNVMQELTLLCEAVNEGIIS